MRISDWSSDVCSSDLAFEYVTGGPIDISDPVAIPRPTGGVPVGDMSDPSITDRTRLQSVALSDQLSFLDGKVLFTAGVRHQSLRNKTYAPTGEQTGAYDDPVWTRSAERRVGQGVVSTFRARGSP